MNDATSQRLAGDSLPAAGTVLKEDFFARTCFDYREGIPVIVKEAKPWRVLGFALDAPARLLANHEASLTRELGAIPGIASFVAMQGRRRFVRRYVAGRILQDVPRVSGAFFDDLERLVREVHAQGVAYVDLAKQENIIVGDDGHAYLIDFQISLRLGPFSGVLRPLRRFLFRLLSREDLFHLAKHRSLKAPETLRPEHTSLLSARSFFNRAHRRLVKPVYNLWTRRLFRRPQTP